MTEKTREEFLAQVLVVVAFTIGCLLASLG